MPPPSTPAQEVAREVVQKLREFLARTTFAGFIEGMALASSSELGSTKDKRPSEYDVGIEPTRILSFEEYLLRLLG